MGVYTYWIVVAAVIILGMVLPQRGVKKRAYIIIMGLLHTFVCGFRYMYLVGDLRKYAATYYSLPKASWFSDYAWHGGRNAGFQWLMKLFSQLTEGNFQIFLILLAIFTQVAVSLLIYKYSSMPWLSYLVWNCMAFYINYDFCAIKQGLAMAVLMFAMIFIMENKPGEFLIATLIASFIHVPAMCFLPAYFLMKRRIKRQTIFIYVILAISIWIFRNQIVQAAANFYYSENDEVDFIAEETTLGGRFLVICLILVVALLLKGFRNRQFEGLFNFIVIAAIFQMFSMYDNVFTRFADYYLQFLVIFVPMIFYEPDSIVETDSDAALPILPFNKRSIRLIVGVLVLVLLWWYNRTCLGATVAYTVDDYTNYRFMWDVMQ